MSIATEIERIKAAKESLKTAINARGGTLEDELIDQYAVAVSNLPTGSDIDVSFVTATADDILAGKVGSDVNGNQVAGTIAQKSAQTYTPGTTDQTIAADTYLSGVQTIKGDANLLAENIKSGVVIFGITGTFEGSGGGDNGESTEHTYLFSITGAGSSEANGRYYDTGEKTTNLNYSGEFTVYMNENGNCKFLNDPLYQRWLLISPDKNVSAPLAFYGTNNSETWHNITEFDIDNLEWYQESGITPLPTLTLISNDDSNNTEGDNSSNDYDILEINFTGTPMFSTINVINGTYTRITTTDDATLQANGFQTEQWQRTSDTPNIILKYSNNSWIFDNNGLIECSSNTNSLSAPWEETIGWDGNSVASVTGTITKVSNTSDSGNTSEKTAVYRVSGCSISAINGDYYLTEHISYQDNPVWVNDNGAYLFCFDSAVVPCWGFHSSNYYPNVGSGEVYDTNLVSSPESTDATWYKESTGTAENMTVTKL